MKDVVIGAVTNYSFDKIKYWVNSLDRSGFDGLKVMVCYNLDYSVAEELMQRGYNILALGRDDENKRFVYQQNFSIFVERFLHWWYFLKKLDGEYRFVIATDVKDVLFQSNPSKWLEENIGDKQINVGCESLHYKDEEWGTHNLFKSFGPVVHDHLKDNLIYNAGTISGRYETMLDLFLNIYMISNGTNHFIEGGGGPDQAALNVILNMKPFKDVTNFAKSEDGWAAQLGTTGPQIQDKYGSKLVEPAPIFKDGVVCTSTGKPFTIVHQYDRIHEWRKELEKKYE